MYKNIYTFERYQILIKKKENSNEIISLVYFTMPSAIITQEFGFLKHSPKDNKEFGSFIAQSCWNTSSFKYKEELESKLFFFF